MVIAALPWEKGTQKSNKQLKNAMHSMSVHSYTRRKMSNHWGVVQKQLPAAEWATGYSLHHVYGRLSFFVAMVTTQDADVYHWQKLAGIQSGSARSGTDNGRNWNWPQYWSCNN